jgi:hypothetical protein
LANLLDASSSSTLLVVVMGVCCLLVTSKSGRLTTGVRRVLQHVSPTVCLPGPVDPHHFLRGCRTNLHKKFLKNQQYSLPAFMSNAHKKFIK